MTARAFRSVQLDGILSFAPGAPPVELQGLNVLIGPNGSGKSNLIDALEILRSTPSDLADSVRLGGGPSEWLWKGTNESSKQAALSVVLAGMPPMPELKYRLSGRRIPLVRPRFVRLATTEIDPSSHQPAGVLLAAYRLQHNHSLTPEVSAELKRLIEWFEANLPEPDRFVRTKSKGFYRRDTVGISGSRSRPPST